MIVRSRPARARPYLLALVLGLSAAGLAACGEKTNRAMIPAQNAAELSQDLDDVQRAIDSKDCGDAARAIGQVRSDLTSLPSGTSQRLESRLEDGVARLEEQAGEECRDTTTTTETETQTTTTETVPTTPTETVAPETVPTTPTETVAPETVPTTPTETTPPDTGGIGVEG